MIKSSRRLPALLSVAFSLALSPNIASQTKPPDSFDTPLQTEVVDLGPSPYTAGRIKLSCYFYPTFMFKEHNDPGLKGAGLAIVPTKKGMIPPCAWNDASEHGIIHECAYFLAVKGGLVFINACDGTNGGVPFMAYDSTTGKKIFEDSAFQARYLGMKVEDSPFNELRVSSAQGGQLFVQYLRVVATDCDLRLREAPCWERTHRDLGLKDARMPVCSGYENVSTRWVSAVACPVEVFFFPRPTTKTIAGPVECWPVD